MHGTRRTFLKGCCSAIAAMSGSRIGATMFDQGSPLVNMTASAASNGEIIVSVFLRGGLDGLSFIPPIAGDSRGFYEGFRPTLSIDTSGDNAALNLNDEFGMHPRCSALHEIYQNGNLAVVNAVGNAGSRSHFDAMTYMELGTPFVKTTKSGWLARTLQTQPDLPPDVLLPVLAAGSSTPTSLYGEPSTLNMSNSSSIGFSNAHWDHRDDLRSAVREMYSDGFSFVKDAGLQALNAADIIETYGSSSYEPANGASYPNSGVGRDLRTIASMIKLDLGLRVATVDFGGWDTHDNQEGYYGNRIADLTNSLAAFYQDLDDSSANPLSKRVTVLVMSEFGRRVRENADRGTDHGSGNVFLVMGGSVKGGVHGNFPGLQNDQLFEQTDLRPTTDYRTIVSEVIIRRLANPNIGSIFPGFENFVPLDIMEGIDLTPQYGPGKPIAPVIEDLSAVSGNALQMTWNQPEFTKGYRVEMRNDPAGDWDLVQIFGEPSQTGFNIEELTPASYYEFRVHAFNDAGTSDYSNTVAGYTWSYEENWRYQHFGQVDPTGDAADDLDVSGNGVTNLMAYALDLDPLSSDLSTTNGVNTGMPQSFKEGAQGKYRFMRPTGREDIRYTVKVSSNMITWATISHASRGVNSEGLEEMVATDLSGMNPCFFKLIVDRS